MKESSKVTTYSVLGVMSGTSLDGLDLALVELQHKEGVWSFDILKSDTRSYAEDWKERLGSALHENKKSLADLDLEFGEFIGHECLSFLQATKSPPDFIASHGHTVFHQPDKGLTLQIGDGNKIYEITKIPVINDFRSLDVSLGGQGAPLVPIGDRLLFSEYDYCINLGGIANLSYETTKGRMAFDICPLNMAFNYLCSSIDIPYDDGGHLARSGTVNRDLLSRLTSIPYLAEPHPKSLGLEDFVAHWKPLLDNTKISYNDKLSTLVEHAAIEISKNIDDEFEPKVLVTGGGVHNHFFIERLNEHLGLKVIVPKPQISEFKEALVFALLGVLRLRNETNCLASVTGASRDNCGGEMYGF